MAMDLHTEERPRPFTPEQLYVGLTTAIFLGLSATAAFYVWQMFR